MVRVWEHPRMWLSRTMVCLPPSYSNLAVTPVPNPATLVSSKQFSQLLSPSKKSDNYGASQHGTEGCRDWWQVAKKGLKWTTSVGWWPSWCRGLRSTKSKVDKDPEFNAGCLLCGFHSWHLVWHWLTFVTVKTSSWSSSTTRFSISQQNSSKTMVPLPGATSSYGEKLSCHAQKGIWARFFADWQGIIRCYERQWRQTHGTQVSHTQVWPSVRAVTCSQAWNKLYLIVFSTNYWQWKSMLLKLSLDIVADDSLILRPMWSSCMNLVCLIIINKIPLLHDEHVHHIEQLCVSHWVVSSTVFNYQHVATFLHIYESKELFYL